MVAAIKTIKKEKEKLNKRRTLSRHEVNMTDEEDNQ